VAQHAAGRRKGGGGERAQRRLRRGRDRGAGRGLDGRIALARGDGQELPLADDSVDCATIAFGIRNMPDPRRCLGEFRRVLRPGGTLAVLEFSMPANRLLRPAYLFYFRRVLPRLGAVISGDSRAYRYLNRTVEDFPHGEEFRRLVAGAGFDDVRMIPLSGAIATIYLGVKRQDGR
ncbi:class I SAM-dependent methyltransferase, partial [bacterium]|nr:class I SAM-dependent methyltransferase [bacterium]